MHVNHGGCSRQMQQGCKDCHCQVEDHCANAPRHNEPHAKHKCMHARISGGYRWFNHSACFASWFDACSCEAHVRHNASGIGRLACRKRVRRACRSRSAGQSRARELVGLVNHHVEVKGGSSALLRTPKGDILPLSRQRGIWPPHGSVARPDGLLRT